MEIPMSISSTPGCHLPGDQAQSSKLSSQVKPIEDGPLQARKGMKTAVRAWDLPDQVSVLPNPAPGLCSEVEPVSKCTRCACRALFLQDPLAGGRLTVYFHFS